MNKTKKIFNVESFAFEVNNKMFGMMGDQQRKIGLREFAKIIGVSAATLSRVTNEKHPDVETFLRLCAWLKSDPKKFIIK